MKYTNNNNQKEMYDSEPWCIIIFITIFELWYIMAQNHKVSCYENLTELCKVNKQVTEMFK